MKPTELARPIPCPPGTPLCKRLMANGRWVAQEKVDGWRCMVDTRGKRVKIWSRHGEPIAPMPGPLWEEIRGLPPGLVLDTELVRPFQELVVFDILYSGHQDLRQQPLAQRGMRTLAAIERCGPRIAPVECAVVEKERFYKIVVNRGGEGIVLKSLADPYPPHKGATWLKVKP